MKETLAWLAVQATTKTADTPPVLCGLTNKIKTALAEIVGNIEGLQAIGPWVFGALVAILVVVSVIPNLRRLVIDKAVWLFGILIAGSVITGIVVLFTHPVC
jgi:hypothetical protein